ncbi:MAG: response regulator [Bacteroidia bacterium]
MTKRKILFVDDEPINLFLVKTFMADVIDIETAESGEEAIKFIEENSDIVYMVVSDLRMPYMDGFELLTILKEQHPKIRRLLLTAYYENEEIRQKVNDGTIEKVFSKTGDMNNLKQEFMQYLEESVSH